MRIFSLVIVIFGIFITCKNDTDSGEEKSVEEIKAENKISSIIRSPVSADEPTDTVNVAKMHFEDDSYDFGKINEGDIVTHIFHFTNTGKVPLVITHARSTCGCTVPDWPKEPIPPGERGELIVEFNSKNKPRYQTKPITITANTYPSTTKVFLTGFVNPKKIEPEGDK